jgi:hypothetical protein
MCNTTGIYRHDCILNVDVQLLIRSIFRYVHIVYEPTRSNTVIPDSTQISLQATSIRMNAVCITQTLNTWSKDVLLSVLKHKQKI